MKSRTYTSSGPRHGITRQVKDGTPLNSWASSRHHKAAFQRRLQKAVLQRGRLRYWRGPASWRRPNSSLTPHSRLQRARPPSSRPPSPHSRLAFQAFKPSFTAPASWPRPNSQLLHGSRPPFPPFPPRARSPPIGSMPPPPPSQVSARRALRLDPALGKYPAPSQASPRSLAFAERGMEWVPHDLHPSTELLLPIP
jgi:hypothetical protein